MEDATEIIGFFRRVGEVGQHAGKSIAFPELHYRAVNGHYRQDAGGGRNRFSFFSNDFEGKWVNGIEWYKVGGEIIVYPPARWIEIEDIGKRVKTVFMADLHFCPGHEDFLQKASNIVRRRKRIKICCTS